MGVIETVFAVALSVLVFWVIYTVVRWRREDKQTDLEAMSSPPLGADGCQFPTYPSLSSAQIAQLDPIDGMVVFDNTNGILIVRVPGEWVPVQ